MLAVSTTQIHLQLSVVVVVVIVVVVVYVRLVQPEEDIESKMPYDSLLTPMIRPSFRPVSYTHLTLPTILRV